MKTPSRAVTIASAAITAAVFSPVAAQASQVDNDSSVGLYVWFDCGVACGNYFVLGRGESATRPGKAGRVQGGNGGDGPGWVCETGDRVSVGAHGEVGIRYEGDKTDPNGQYGGMIPGTETFTWVSKGENDWTSDITHNAKHKDGICWFGTP